MGAFLAERGFAPDAIVTSPKLRARQTAELVADAIGIAVAVDERLGGPLDPDDVGDIAERAGGTSVVLVGHDPDFSDLCAALTGHRVPADEEGHPGAHRHVAAGAAKWRRSCAGSCRPSSSPNAPDG